MFWFDKYTIRQGHTGQWFVVFKDGMELEWFTEDYPEYLQCATYCFGQYENAFAASDFYKVNQ